MVVQLLAVTSWERVVIWLPAGIVGFGIVAAVLILLGRAFAASVRESRHPRWIVGGVVALVGVVVVLTWLGVSLPRE
jgi:O-antigen ligase